MLQDKLTQQEKNHSPFEDAVRKLATPACAVFRKGKSVAPVGFQETGDPLTTGDSAKIAPAFPRTSGQNRILAARATTTKPPKGKRVAVLFSGGPRRRRPQRGRGPQAGARQRQHAARRQGRARRPHQGRPLRGDRRRRRAHLQHRRLRLPRQRQDQDQDGRAVRRRAQDLPRPPASTASWSSAATTRTPTPPCSPSTWPPTASR